MFYNKLRNNLEKRNIFNLVSKQIGFTNNCEHNLEKTVLKVGKNSIEG